MTQLEALLNKRNEDLPDIMLQVFGFIIAGQINLRKRKPLKKTQGQNERV